MSLIQSTLERQPATTFSLVGHGRASFLSKWPDDSRRGVVHRRRLDVDAFAEHFEPGRHLP